MTTDLLPYVSTFSKIPQIGVKTQISFFVFKTPLSEICNPISFALKHLTAKSINFLCVNMQFSKLT